MSDIRVLMVHGDPGFGECAGYLLRRFIQEVDIVEAGSFGDALERAGDGRQFHLILLDSTTPEIGSEAAGFEGLRTLRERAPAVPIFVVSTPASRSDVQHVVDGDALGYIPKRMSAGAVLSALELVAGGVIHLSVSPISRRCPTTEAPTPRPNGPTVDNRSTAPRLTERQRDVLALIGQGKPNKVIADELGISVNTVKLHVGSILRTLGVASRTQAALATLQMGFADSISVQLQTVVLTGGGFAQPRETASLRIRQPRRGASDRLLPALSE